MEEALAGYTVTFEREISNYTVPTCVSCFEQNHWQIWDYQPIAYKDADEQAIRCDWCHQLLVVDSLQRQIDTAGRILRDWYAITQDGPVGVTDFGSHDDFVRLKALRARSESFYFHYVEHKIF